MVNLIMLSHVVLNNYMSLWYRHW